jgi:hypothetical protein
MVVAEKVIHFHDKNKDLSQLGQKIVEMLQDDGYKTEINAKAPQGVVIQATKADIMREIITADRAFTILLTGDPNNFVVHIGIGRLVSNLGIAAAETILFSGLFLVVDIPEMLWTRHVEKEIVERIVQLIG